jgi:hypothetical protein
MHFDPIRRKTGAATSTAKTGHWRAQKLRRPDSYPESRTPEQPSPRTAHGCEHRSFSGSKASNLRLLEVIASKSYE